MQTLHFGTRGGAHGRKESRRGEFSFLARRLKENAVDFPQPDAAASYMALPGSFLNYP
ncbi:hypothetical protein [Cupriavidus agavae]|uniref:hypothetical protein n=1 Tax=Cupriavidus agavae TaxID=1001822 RepID=UPI0013001EE8|nr:hypothetical protein [Cupriavidus agavae]